MVSLHHKALLRLGFTQCSTDARIYKYISKSGTLTVVVVLGHILMSCDSHSLLRDLKMEMQRFFKFKLPGRVKSFIGLDIETNKTGIKVIQTTYVKKISKGNGLSNENSSQTPLHYQCDLKSKGIDELIRAPSIHNQYGKMVANVMYLDVSSTPDITLQHL